MTSAPSNGFVLMLGYPFGAPCCGPAGAAPSTLPAVPSSSSPPTADSVALGQSQSAPSSVSTAALLLLVSYMALSSKGVGTSLHHYPRRRTWRRAVELAIYGSTRLLPRV